MDPLLLGIDTGGTYTDAVALEAASGQVLATAKALTTRADLARGIANAIAGLAGIDRAAVRLVCLSTTLATNAIVEGHGGRVCLLLLGYDPELIERFGFRGDLVVDDVVHIRGGHDIYGQPRAPLDEEALRRAVAERAGQVDAFAISDYLGVRNPAHEQRARELVSRLSGLPVTCGHELGEELNSIRRATTVALNARLIPLLRDLLRAVERALAAQGIHAPLALVRGDGSLMSAALALEHPVETILSGPAASVIGAQRLTGRDDLLVVDMGGTTTDLAVLRHGRPRISGQGARVGGWRTLVQAVDTRSTGLGGDSHVTFDGDGLSLGPGRVVPLALAAQDAPELLAALARLRDSPRLRPGEPQFLALVGHTPPPTLSDTEQEILACLQDGMRSLEEIVQRVSWARVYLGHPNRLEASGLVQRVGFTPTDALHVLGTFAPWNHEAALLGATILGRPLGWSPTALAEETRRLVCERLAREIVAQVAAEEGAGEDLPSQPGAGFFLTRALHPDRDTALNVSCRLHLPIAAIGAPVGAYLPPVAAMLRAELVIPEHAEVANAIGAASGSVLQTVEVLVEPEYNAGGIVAYRVHTPEARLEFRSIEVALSHAREAGRRLALALAQRAGAGEVLIEEEQCDQTGSVAPGRGADLYLGTRLRFTAIGRPRWT